MRIYLPLTILCLFLSLRSFATIYYVNQNAVGTRDGSSWANAFTNLRWALGVAGSGDIIKVAAGVYQPSGLNGGDSTFTLARGVSLLGGYPNTGNPSDAQRNWVTQPTILSGNGTNSIVVTAAGIDTATLFDGFFVIQGYGGYVGDGSGMQISNCSGLNLQHVIFQNNIRGAIAITGSQAVFTDCVIDHNNPGSYGIIHESANSNASFYNCLITGNGANSPGAYIIYNQDADLQLINCSIANNNGPAFYGAGTGIATMRNTIFWNNVVNYSQVGGDIVSGGQTLDIANCMTQTYYQTGSNNVLVNDNPRFYNAANPAGADNTFFTADDGLQLTAPCSPALNSGDNSVITGIATDILGNPRVYNGGTVDLGAYELQSTPGPVLTTVYVNGSATGAGNGSSWQDAFPTLQQALLYCADTVKVAAGVYLTADSYRDSVFSIESGKVILGGYPAIGSPTDADRNPAAYPTLLEGNYPPSNTGSASPVLEAFHSDSSTLIDGLAFANQSFLPYAGGSVPALHIGYVSKLRVANCQFQFVSNGSSIGGGILISDTSSPVITRSTVSSTVSTYSSPSILCEQYSSPVISYCQFTGNTNTNSSSLLPHPTGAIHFDHCMGTMDSCTFFMSLGDSDAIAGAVASTIQLNNCVFRAINSSGYLLINTNGSNGAVNNCVFKNINGSYSIYNDNSSPVFSKCLFDSTNVSVNNVDYSSPVFNNCVSINGRLMLNVKSFPQLNNCTVLNTYVSPVLGSNLNEQALIINADSSTLRADNTIFWGSKLTGGWKDIADTTTAGYPAVPSTSVLSNCITRNYGVNGVNGNLVGVDPRFFQLSNIYGPDGVMFTADDGIRLALCSPAVNTGNNGLGTVLATDVLGNPRIFDNIVDIGAYELQQNPVQSHSYYVNAGAGGSSDGMSWANAYTSLQTAMCDACADTIRVAAGTYTPAVTDMDSSFVINRDFTLYGGYPAAGSPGDAQRDPFANPTILSGNIGSPGDSTDNSNTIVAAIGVPDSATIDGFVIRDGYSADDGISLNMTGGSGFYAYNSKAIIKNCQFIHNHTGLYGGAIAFGGLDSCIISRSIFTGNSAGAYGGAIAATGAYLQVNNCVFDSNYAYGKGGAIQLGGIFNMQGCLFYRNYTTNTSVVGAGGAVDASLGGGNIVNCTFVDNSSGYMYTMGGGGVYTNRSLGIRLYNCIFNGNITGNSTTAKGADVDIYYNTVFNCLLQVNYGNTANLWTTNPGFTNIVLPLGRDGKWMTADDGLQLLYNSPGVNYGSNSAVTELTTDLAGNPRIVGGTVDAGAYEYQDQPFADAGNDTTVCTADSISIGMGGDPAFTYTWASSPAGFSSTSAIAVARPTVPTTYYLTATNGTTTSTDSVHIGVTDSVGAAITIYTDTTGICQGANVLFTASAVYGGDSAVYQWQVNGVNVGADSPRYSSSTLTDSSKVTAILTSSVSCALPKTVSSNVLTMKVGAIVAPSVSLIAPQGPICIGSDVAVKAVPVNGGSQPSFQWNIDGNTNYISTDSLGFNIPDTATRIYVVMTSSNGCAVPNTASSQLVVHTTPPAPAVVSIAASQTAVCAKENVSFTATPTNGGATPFYQWLVNGRDAGTNSNTYSSANFGNGDVISVILTSSSACASPSTDTSNTISLTVSPLLTVAITVSGITTVVEGDAAVLTASIFNGGATPQYQWQDSTAGSPWQDIAGDTTAVLSYTPTVSGTAVRCLFTSSIECPSEKTVASTPLILNITSATTTSDSNHTIRYYPNPVRGVLTVDSMSVTDGWETLEIRGLDGQAIISAGVTGQTRVTVDMTALPDGIYILCLLRKNGTNFYRKIVKL
jgi:predicted outer membrane repeat protein